jgi:hypothetical protein
MDPERKRQVDDELGFAVAIYAAYEFTDDPQEKFRTIHDLLDQVLAEDLTFTGLVVGLAAVAHVLTGIGVQSTGMSRESLVSLVGESFAVQR